MSGDRMTFYGADEYDRLLVMAKRGESVLLDGHTYIITEVAFDGMKNRGYYRIDHVVTARPAETLAVIAQGIG